MHRDSSTRKRPLVVELLESRRLLSSSALSYSLTTNQSTYQAGQPVQMSFTETNTSSRPVTISIGPSNTGFDVRQNGTLVWVSNAGIQPQFLRQETLLPGQAVTLQATWNGVPNVSGASSHVTGTFTVTNQQAPTDASATFVIQSAQLDPLPRPGQLTYTLTTNQSTYRVGQPIIMTFTETNTSNQPVEVALGPTTAGFDVFHNGRIVWQSNLRAPFVPVKFEPLLPGQSVTITATWNGIPNEAQPVVETGTFTVTNQQAPAGPSATFQILSQPGVNPPPPLMPTPVSGAVTTHQSAVPRGQSVSTPLTLLHVVTTHPHARLRIVPGPRFRVTTPWYLKPNLN
jgi:hypothetical protein